MTDKGEVKRLVEGLLKRRPRRVVSVPVRGGRRSEILTAGKQGRYVKHRAPQGEGVVDIAILPTIMSAIMHSRGGKVEVKRRDYREKVRRKKTSSLITLVMDTSSSMVSHRKMEALQSVLDELLLDAYQKRDRIALVACQGSSANVVLPFTTSVERGKKLLAKLPFGGTTPLSRGIRLGIKTLTEKLTAEPAAASLIMVVSDGGANTPESVGGDPVAELKAISRNIKERGLKMVFVDVNPEGSELLKMLAEEAEGSYFHAVIIGGAKLIDPSDYADVDTLVSSIGLAMANPAISGVLFENFKDGVMDYALDRLRTSLLEMNIVEGCPFGCDPADEENYCYWCELKNASGDVVSVGENMPVVVLPDGVDAEDLWGEVYVHYLVRGGVLQGVHRGILYIPDIGALEDGVAESLADTLDCGYRIARSEDDVVVYPCRFTIVAGGSRDSVPRCLEPHILMRVDRQDLDILEDRTRNIMYQKMFDTDPSRFENQLHRKWQDVLSGAAKNRPMAKTVWFGDRELGICRRLESAIPVLKDVTRLQELAKAYAVMEGSEDVRDHHIHHAARAAVGLLGDASRSNISSPQSEFADIAESMIVKDKLILPFVNRQDLKLVLVNGFDSSIVSGATQFIKYLMLKMQCVQGCLYNDDPTLPETWCRECRLRHDPNNPPAEEREVPIVQVAHESTVEELKGTLFLARVIGYNIFSFAHRGVVFVENIDEMEDPSAEALADVLSRGENVVANIEYAEKHGSRFPVIGTLSHKGAEINPLLLEQASIMVQANHIDWLEMHLLAYEYEQDFGEDPDGIVQAVSLARETAKFQLANAREMLERVQIGDSEMDLVTRICMDLGPPGNSTEMKIGAAARTLAAYEGVERVSEKHILEASRLVLPMSLLVGEAEETGEITEEEAARVV